MFQEVFVSFFELMNFEPNKENSQSFLVNSRPDTNNIYETSVMGSQC